jgi:anti-sigma B factor antagonist
MAAERPHITVMDADGVRVVRFSDRKILDELAITQISDELTKLVEGTIGIRLLVSFKDVEHLSSAALGVLIKLNNDVNNAGGRLKLSDITPRIFEVFRITGLNRIFDIYETTGRALESFHS